MKEYQDAFSCVYIFCEVCGEALAREDSELANDHSCRSDGGLR